MIPHNRNHTSSQSRTHQYACPTLHPQEPHLGFLPFRHRPSTRSLTSSLRTHHNPISSARQLFRWSRMFWKARAACFSLMASPTPARRTPYRAVARKGVQASFRERLTSFSIVLRVCTATARYVYFHVTVQLLCKSSRFVVPSCTVARN